MSGEHHLYAGIAQPAQAHCSTLSPSIGKEKRKDDGKKKCPQNTECVHAGMSAQMHMQECHDMALFSMCQLSVSAPLR